MIYFKYAFTIVLVLLGLVYLIAFFNVARRSK